MKSYTFISTAGGDEHGASEVAYCVVTITPEYARELLGRIDLVRGIKATDSSVWGVAYFDHSASWEPETPAVAAALRHAISTPAEIMCEGVVESDLPAIMCEGVLGNASWKCF